MAGHGTLDSIICEKDDFENIWFVRWYKLVYIKTYERKLTSIHKEHFSKKHATAKLKSLRLRVTIKNGRKIYYFSEMIYFIR